MKPFQHAKNSAKKYGGQPDEYQAVHDFIDSTKAALPDMRHRAILHSAFGCYLVEQLFGTTITNSEGRRVCTRDLAEDHIIEDLGFIPTVERWLRNMNEEPWMFGSERGKKTGQGRRFIKID